MKFFKKLFERKNNDNRLIGSWKSDQSDEFTRTTLGDVLIRFTKQGDMIYTIKQPNKDQVIYLKYETANGMIISDQPSMPRKEETEYLLQDESTLFLIHEGIQTKFIKTN